MKVSGTRSQEIADHSGRHTEQHTIAATIGGGIAILLWSTTIAVARSLSEQLGSITSAATVYSVGGIIAIVSLLSAPSRRKQIFRLPKRYLIGCGALFVGYMVLLYLAIGLAGSRRQVLEVGLLNYLWPVMTLVFSLIILGVKTTWILWPGTALALIGIFLVITQGEAVSLQSFAANLASNPVTYSLAFAAAVFWATYSNLTRRWVGGRAEGAVVLFLPVTAVILVILSFTVDEPRAWSLRPIIESLFLGIATYAGYALWDHAMRKANLAIVTASSYLTPLFSTIVSCFYLAVVPRAQLWVGCIFLITGSFLSWRSVTRRRSRLP